MMSQQTHRILIAAGLIVSFFAGGAAGKDDDIEFATSLGRAGYTWLAVEEFEKLKDSDDQNERILRNWGLAQLYEQIGDLQKRDRANTEFLKEAESSTDALIRGYVDEIKSKVWDNKEQTLIRLVNDLENALRAVNPDKGKLARLRSDARKVSDEIVRFRRDLAKKYQDMETAGTLTEEDGFKLDQAKFFLGRTLYYHSFTLKGDNEEERKKILNEIYTDTFSSLMYMYGDRVVLIPFFAGMTLWELEKYSEGATAFMQCVDFPADPTNEELRKEAYYRAVECYLKINNYRQCTETAFYYLVEFPGNEDRVSFRGQAIRLDLALALNRMEPAAYDEVKQIINVKGKRDEEARNILIKIESENGPKSAEAREILREVASGYIKYIAEGMTKYLDKEYDKAASALQKGLKEVPADLTYADRLTKVAQAWYYLGFSYYNQGMVLPAIICFKEGTTRFMKDFKEYGERLTPEQQQWFLQNRENWKNVAGMYYQSSKSDLSLNIFKEALIAYGQVKGGGDEEESGLNINVNIAIILMREEGYSEAIDELKKVGLTSPEYSKAVRLTAQCKWGLYEKSEKRDKGLAREAFTLFDSVIKMLEDKLRKTTDDEEKKFLGDEIAETKGRLVGLLYKDEQYQQILDGIEAFWANPPQKKSVAFSALRYQIYSAINLKADDKDWNSLKKKKDALLQANTLLERARREYSEPQNAENILKTIKSLGFSFYNLAAGIGPHKKPEDVTACLNLSGSLLYDFIMNAGQDIDENVLAAVADILHERLKDYKRSEEVTARILTLFTERVQGLYAPYEDTTREGLESLKTTLFDRAEARSAWDRFIDSMYDGKGTDGTTHDRPYFMNRLREFWEEQPYSYEKSFENLSEAIMIELGWNPEKRGEQAALRDSEKGEAADKFWKDLFAAYTAGLGRSTDEFNKIYTFLDNSILVKNYRYRLAECYGYNNKPEKALELFKALDDYYITEPSAKWAVGDTYMKIAQAAKGDERKKNALAAKEVYLWIEKHAPGDSAVGRTDHYKAVLKGAAAYAVAGEPKGAVSKLTNALKYDPIPMPEGFESQVKEALAIYEKQAGTP